MRASGAGRGHAVALPEHIVLVDASPAAAGGASACLLADFREAYRAYALDMASSFGVDAAVAVPRFAWVDAGRDAGEEAEAGDGDTGFLGGGDDAHQGCDTALVACVAPGAEAALGAQSLESDAARAAAAALCGGCRTYAIVVSRGRLAGDGRPAFRALRQGCEEGGALWMGGVLVGGGALLARFSNAPRMGHVRRRVSEAIDEMVMAAMAGEPCGAKEAGLAVPGFAYRRLAASCG